MQLLSLEFAFFFLGVLALSWTLRERNTAWRFLLLAASYIFYASFHPGFALLLFGVSAATWAAARLLARPAADALPLGPSRRAILATYLVVVLGELCFFKYYGLASDLTGLLPEITLLMPVGISFFTFQGIGCVMDAYRNPDGPRWQFMDVLLFMAFFPTVMSGPILRARDFIPQLHDLRPAWTDSNQAFWLIAVGLFKKVALSSYLSEHVTRQLFSAPEGFSSLGALMGVLAYSAQIYLDFSGYSDLAQGLAGLLGLRVPDNFHSPYKARNLQEFWQGWHISLSTWLRDYLYIPLGGSRCSAIRRDFNLLATMGLGGFWHGASLNFLAWGLLHGAGLVATHHLGGRLKLPAEGWMGKACDALKWACTFGFVTLAWVFFAAPDFATAMDVLARIASLDGEGTGPGLTLAVITVSVIALQGLRLDVLRACPAWLERLPAPAFAAALGLLAALIVRMGPDGMLPFIYFSF
ncbi:MBOAT family O-acyltransferase [Fundidesulfovibrio agrisoli]|uniref:MBOAT family O-acyltransferase n=1 Tax=Fundidesulfovibrio agrisoli TaxID=2922717 RepID=UPI001FAC905B|nr:MBOAT family O-acyltransferase [Fundidesulfovibrio agrisoli]